MVLHDHFCFFLCQLFNCQCATIAIFLSASYILAYLFDYKLKDTSLEKGWKECGFPITNVSKIMARLEEKKINYILIDRRNNYDVDGKMDFGNLNRYQATYEKSNK